MNIFLRMHSKFMQKSPWTTVAFSTGEIVYIVYLLLMACLFSNGVHVFFQIEAESITCEKWNWLKKKKIHDFCIADLVNVI